MLAIALPTGTAVKFLPLGSNGGGHTDPGCVYTAVLDAAAAAGLPCSASTLDLRRSAMAAIEHRWSTLGPRILSQHATVLQVQSQPTVASYLLAVTLGEIPPGPEELSALIAAMGIFASVFSPAGQLVSSVGHLCSWVELALGVDAQGTYSGAVLGSRTWTPWREQRLWDASAQLHHVMSQPPSLDRAMELCTLVNSQLRTQFTAADVLGKWEQHLAASGPQLRARTSKQAQAGSSTAASCVTDLAANLKSNRFAVLGEPCQSCGLPYGFNVNEIILCNGCNHGWHQRCLQPPLAAVPEGSWHCSACSVGPCAAAASGSQPKVAGALPKQAKPAKQPPPRKQARPQAKTTAASTSTAAPARRGRGHGRQRTLQQQVDTWQQITAALCYSALIACAFCGLGTFPTTSNLRNWGIHTPPSPVQLCPALIHNPLLVGRTTSPCGGWLVCPTCSANTNWEPRADYLVPMAPEYVRSVVSLRAEVQMELALVNVGAGFIAHAAGYMATRLRRPGPLPAALLRWDPDPLQRAGTMSQAARDLLSWSILHNPIYRRFLSVVEHEAHVAPCS